MKLSGYPRIMTILFNTLILLSFILEIGVLLYLEFKTWKSVYTPLFFLTVPYFLILILTLLLPLGKLGFINFYFPSILIWSVGLIVFSIPSYLIGGYLTKHGVVLNKKMESDSMPKVILFLATLLCILFIWHLKGISSASDYMVGSDAFGTDFAGQGFWGHIRQLLLPIFVISVFYVKKRDWFLIGLIIIMLVIFFLYQILSWIIIPTIAALFMRLYSGKSKFKISTLFYLLLGVILIFTASYVVALVVVGGADMKDTLLFVLRNFFHYLSSGTLGLSMDMQMGFLESANVETVISAPINIVNKIMGETDMLMGLNKFYLNTGVNLTNVRTFFGTSFIFLTKTEWILFILVISSTIYFLKYCTIIWPNVFTYTIFFFECSLLFMGWFDSYFANLTAYEFPVITILLYLLVKLLSPKKEKIII
ncbi:MAG TPA: DUF6337 family protein [Bacteroidaceae bacterium]|nr:DUF6337 family protein [Bacteroidaceae bacterium]